MFATDIKKCVLVGAILTLSAVCLGRTAEETYQAVLVRTADWVSVDKGWQFRLDGGKWQTSSLAMSSAPAVRT